MLCLGMSLTRFTKRRLHPPDPPEPGNPFDARNTALLYRCDPEGSWTEEVGIARLVPDTNRVVHMVEITGLPADSQVQFRLPDLETPAVYVTYQSDPTSTVTVHWHTYQPHTEGDYGGSYSDTIHKTRTLPATLGAEDTLRIAQVSDTHGREGNAAIFAAIGARDARLIVHSGDMATGNGGEAGPGTWYILFDAITNNAINSDGEIIPILACIGNHEIWAGAAGVEWSSTEVGVKPDFDAGTRGDAEWFYSFFPAYPGLRGFNLIDVGDYLSIWTLDPGISTRLDDESDSQVEWLEDTLAERQSVPHRLVTLHYSPWPSGRRVMVPYFRVTRSTFGPVMQAGGVRLCLVGHEHVLSRTVPINEWGELAHQENHEPDPDGIVFVGSGPSGASVQHGRNPRTKWWLHDSVASQWRHYDFEDPGLNPASSPGYEPRQPHPDDGTTFEAEAVRNWWEIDIGPTSRTIRAWHSDGTMWDEFTQPADPVD